MLLRRTCPKASVGYGRIVNNVVISECMAENKWHRFSQDTIKTNMWICQQYCSSIPGHLKADKSTKIKNNIESSVITKGYTVITSLDSRYIEIHIFQNCKYRVLQIRGDTGDLDKTLENYKKKHKFNPYYALYIRERNYLRSKKYTVFYLI